MSGFWAAQVLIMLVMTLFILLIILMLSLLLALIILNGDCVYIFDVLSMLVLIALMFD